MPQQAILILAAVAAVVCTVLILVFITPEKKRAGLNKFFKFLHDLFNFNFLIIEKILKVLYILATTFVVALGFFMLFGVAKVDLAFYERSTYLGGYGILVMILGPIVVRLAYELIMMAILLVKNVIQINRKLPDKGDNADEGSPFGIPDRGDYASSGFGGTGYRANTGAQPGAAPQSQYRPDNQPSPQGQPASAPQSQYGTGSQSQSALRDQSAPQQTATAAAEDFTFCPNCGVRQPKGAVFCGNCGAKIGG